MKTGTIGSFAFLTASMAALSLSSADVRLPAVIADSMVLQQGTKVPIWGWADPGETVTLSASWNGAAAVLLSTKADEKGDWRFLVSTPAAADAAKINGGSHIITIAGKNTITLKDVLIGEVWICSGQSNMEWNLAASDGAEEAIKKSANPRIRLFTVENTVAASPQRDCRGKWVASSPETTPGFSAVGYHFGLNLIKALDVPIGLIASDWGGTPAEAWTSEATMRSMPDFADQMAMVDALRKQEQTAAAGGVKKANPAFDAWLKQIDEADTGSRDPKVDPRGGWWAEAFDDSKWTDAAMPAQWGGDLASFDGIVWARTSFDIPSGTDLEKAMLFMPAIDDCDTTWINGVKAGESMADGMHDKPRVYAVPKGVLKQGRNVISVRMLDTGGPGGMAASPEQLRLELKNSGKDPWVHSLAQAWKMAKGAANAQLPRRPGTLAPSPNLSTNLYNGMIAPVIPYAIRGAIWYQGESNAGRAFQYRTLFPAMITDWRTQWAKAAGTGEKSDFPFLFVQIAPFGYGGDTGQAAELREAQFLTLSLPNTGMAVTMDIGNATDIHPRNKIDVGKRLSLWALAKTYGKKDLVYSGPLYNSSKAADGKVRISFDHVGGGLDSGGQLLTCFTIAGEDRKFVPAKAAIDGNTIVVFSDAVPRPVAVRFAWGAADMPNLKNKEGLPASSFRTDKWPGVTEPAKPKSTGSIRKPLKLENGRRLVLEAPIDRWDEAIPLGNGLMGGLLWGKDNTINLSLDRGDLWDLRVPDTLKRPDWTYDTMKKLVAAKDQAKLVELFDAPYEAVPYPTKLPAGRLVIHLDESLKARSFALDLKAAEASIETGTLIRSFFSATSPVGMLTYTGPPPKLEILRPAGLDKLGYKPAEFGNEGSKSSRFVWMRQEAAEGLTYVVAAAVRSDTRTSRLNTIAVTITSTQDGLDPLDLARERLEDALGAGYDAVRAPHATWWEAFWKISSVKVPDEQIQAHYDLCKYFYGSASRATGPTAGPPMPLQGVWTADEGGLPPWKGDFHNDLNTQMTYLAYHTAGLNECGLSWLNFNMKLLPRYKRFAKEFYGVEGAVVPGVMTLTGDPMGGWGMYSLSPTNGAWVARSFHLHWRYTQDERFLNEVAGPFCFEIARAINNLLGSSRTDGARYLPRVLPLSSSPEIHDNSLQAWLIPNSNYDASLIRCTFGAPLQAIALSKAMSSRTPEERVDWLINRPAITPLDVDSSGSLTFAKNEPYTESHRHFSHTMAIHPLMLVNIDGSNDDRRIVNASIDRILEKGTSQWCGYSFSWMSCILATIARPEQSLDYLEKYMRGFILRNGFHCNGDQSGTGMSNFTYRPFTLEGNFLAMQAVQDMLIQSWGERVRIFPAVSVQWPDVSFADLRAEGGFRVSATREQGRTTSVSITATVDHALVLRDPFGGQPARWNRSDIKFGNDLTVTLRAGETLTGALSR